MILKSPTIARVLLIRPGATEFDDQGRIKGSLDMPLSSRPPTSQDAGERIGRCSIEDDLHVALSVGS